MSEPMGFDDPVAGRLAEALLAVAAELNVTRDRLRALEGLVVRAGVASRDDLEAWMPDDAERAAADADRELLVRAVLDALLPPPAREPGGRLP